MSLKEMTKPSSPLIVRERKYLVLWYDGDEHHLLEILAQSGLNHEQIGQLARRRIADGVRPPTNFDVIAFVPDAGVAGAWIAEAPQ